MPETLILHLGLHKTATTALQDFLAANVKTLFEHGVVYPGLARMRSDLTPLIMSADKPDRAELARFVDRSEPPVLLLSDENILGSPGDIVGGRLYPFGENRVRRFCDQFADRRVRLFLTLREPAPFLASMYCEYLRHNSYLSFEEYIRGFDLAGFSYGAVFDWLFALPPHVAVTVTPFEEARGGGVGVIAGRLLEAACGPEHGIDTASFPDIRSRSSFSVEELRTAATIAGAAGARTAQFFLNMLDGRGCRFGDIRFAPLEPTTVAALDARYRQDLAAFARLSEPARLRASDGQP